MATTQMTAIKCQKLVANVSRTGLMTHFPSGAQGCGCQGAYSRKRGNKTRETPTSSCDECAAMEDASGWPSLRLSHSPGQERNGNQCFKEPQCRLLVILLVVSSLRISEYSRSTIRRIKPSGGDFMFSRANQSKLGLLLLLPGGPR